MARSDSSDDDDGDADGDKKGRYMGSSDWSDSEDEKGPGNALSDKQRKILKLAGCPV